MKLSSIVHVLRKLQLRSSFSFPTDWKHIFTRASLSHQGLIPTQTRYQEWKDMWDTPNHEETLQLTESIDKASLRLLVILMVGNKQDMEKTLVSLDRSDFSNWDITISTKKCSKTERDYIQLLRQRYHSRWCDSTDSADQYHACVLIHPGVILRPHALHCGLKAILNSPIHEWLFYSDEDRFNRNRGFHSPLFKPAASVAIHQSLNLLGEFIFVRLTNRKGRLFMYKYFQSSSSNRSIATFLPNELDLSEVHHISHILYHDKIRRRARYTLATSNHTTTSRNTHEKLCVIIICDGIRSIRIHQSLESIVKQRSVAVHEIKVVCNTPSSALLSQLRRIEHDGIKTQLVSSKCQFWGGLSNRAIEQSNDDIIVIVSAGATIDDPRTLQRLVNEASCDESGVVGVLHDQDLACIRSGPLNWQLKSHLVDHDLKRTLREMNRQPWNLPFIMGDIIAFRRILWQESGGFMEELSQELSQLKLSAFCLEKGLSNRSCPVMSTTQGVGSLTKNLRQDAHLHLSSVYDQGRNDLLPLSTNRALSASSPLEIAVVPQLESVWKSNNHNHNRTIIIFSCVLSQGYGVALVVKIHARHLRRLGYQVIIAGPSSADELLYKGCRREFVNNENDASVLIERTNPIASICHTPPFFTLSCLLGAHHTVMAVDHGEPPPSLFRNYRERQAVQRSKEVAMRRICRVYAISNAVAQEATWPVHGVIELGNTHIKQWRGEMSLPRHETRLKHNWSNKWVILSVCRIQHRERSYKGFEQLYELREWMQRLRRPDDLEMVYVVCGRGNQHDEDELTKQGFFVMRNVNDHELEKIYASADVYVSQSQWEGFNLGIAQALAMGLDVFASDIPAHRQFSIHVSNDLPMTAEKILFCLRNTQRRRAAKRLSWQKGLKSLASAVEDVIHLRETL